MEKQPTTTIIIGQSDDCEAEYGVRADDAVTVICLYNDEMYSWDGYPTIAAAKAEYSGDAEATYLYL